MAEELERPAQTENGEAQPGRLRRAGRWIKACWAKLPPRPEVRRGAGRGALAAAALVALLIGISMRPGLGKILDIPAGALFALALAALIGLATVLVYRVVYRLHFFIGWTGLACLAVIFSALDRFGFSDSQAFLLALLLVALQCLLGGAWAFFRLGGWPRLPKPKKAFLALAILAALGMDAFVIWWLIDDGDSSHLVAYQAESHQPLQGGPLELKDPSQPGSFRVLSLTYGSGSKRRPEFGEGADLKTEPVDAAALVKGSKGWKVKVRHWYWGFDFKEFPRNATVWYPDGAGPFPLVLIVHGNHNMDDYSDPGYAYLGEHLASRGFILASVDENFFNGFWSGGLSTENDGRGWMLLQHLRQWREWQQTEGNPFYGRVDLENIGLIGHSRGGEAAAIAGAFNRLSRYPDDATLEFDFGFSIRAVIAIAPSDGQYNPSDAYTPLKNVNYLVLQGAHDADVSVFAGARQYRRTRFDDGQYWFKASLYSYRSNHGQFNTVWGRTDFSWPASRLLNLAPLLTGEEQRRLGKVYMTAFLEASLLGRDEYLNLFRDHRRALEWLPEDDLITRFEDSTFRSLCDFEEDVDVTTASLPGASIEGQNLAVWREEHLEFRRRGSKRNKVAYLGWKAESESESEEQEAGPASYSIRLPQGLAGEWALDGSSVLVFSLAEADEKPPDKDEEEEEDSSQQGEADQEEEAAQEEAEEEDEEEEKPPLDLSLELETAEGSTSRLPVSRFRILLRPLKSRFTKLSDESDRYGKAWEPALQTFEIPLSAFTEARPDFDLSSLSVIRLVFDRSPEGVLILDDLGFAGSFAQSRKVAKDAK